MLQGLTEQTAGPINQCHDWWVTCRSLCYVTAEITPRASHIRFFPIIHKPVLSLPKWPPLDSLTEVL